MTNNIDNVPMNYLLAMFLDYHFQDKRLLDVSHETLTLITDEMNDLMPLMDITIDDAKAAWICWLEETAYIGKNSITIRSLMDSVSRL